MPEIPIRSSVASTHCGSGFFVFNPQRDRAIIKEKTKIPKISKNSGRTILNKDCMFILYSKYRKIKTVRTSKISEI